MAAPSTLQPPLLCPCPAVNGKQMSVGCKHWMEGAGYKPHWIFMALFSQPFSERGCVLRGWHWPDCCSLYFSQPCPCGSPGGVGVFCVKGPMCREVARVTHASCLTLSPFGPGSAPCTGLTEIPFLETAKERVFAFSSGECDVMSLGSGQAGRDRPRWAQSRATRRHASGGKAVKNKQADEWQEEGATSGVPTLLPGAGRVAVLPGEPSTEAGSDPNPAVLARSVPSQVTPVPRSPGHSPLLPSQPPVEARQPRLCARGSLWSRRAPCAELAVSPPGVQKPGSAGGGGSRAVCSAVPLFPAQPGGSRRSAKAAGASPRGSCAPRASLRVRSGPEQAAVTLRDALWF
ncbi:uncharacterized protein LOC134555201 isoform X1 [Prinia subflava]|uniref:uncharacterized protein LOC134555201 isoform X1 n=1 Tax=Prinia subflava TaxID=208062 RepID=UPI002FE1F0CF